MTEKTGITSDEAVSAYDKREFDEAYTYDGNDLGAVWSPKATVFKVWAPTVEKRMKPATPTQERWAWTR